MNTRSVIVCDDHPIFRNGVIHCIEEIPDLKVVGVCSDVESAIAKLKIYTPDILISDLSMPGKSGFELLEWAKANMPEMRVIVMSMHTGLSFVQRARRLGASGFLAKDDTETDLVRAIEADIDVFYTSESIGRESAPAVLPDEALDIQNLLKYVSAAEMKVLIQLSQSQTNKEIAEHLNLSPRTIEAHRNALAEKLDVKGPNKLLEFAIRNHDLLNK